MDARSARFKALSANGKATRTAHDFDAIETRSLFRALWQGRWQIGGLALAAGMVVWIAMHQVTPTFTVYAKLMLDTRKVQIVSGTDVVSDIAPSAQIVNSEVGVLQSNLVIEKMLAGLTPRQWDQLDPALKPQSFLSRVKSAGRWLFGGAAPVVPVDEDFASRKARIIDAVQNMRSAYAQPDSYLMVIRVDAADPALARDMANGLADSYIQLQLENRRSTVVRATDWLEGQLGDLRQQVEKAERAVAQFQADSLISDGGTLDSLTQQLTDLNAQLATVRTARVEAESRLGQLTNILADKDIEAAASIIDTSVMKDLVSQQMKLRQDDAIYARSYDATQSRRVEIQTKLDDIRAAMQTELESAISAARSDLSLARSREAGISSDISALESKVTSMTANQIGLRQLNREADAARQTYESFLARITETRAQKELQQPDALVVERAMLPEAPSAPRPTLLATLAVTVTAALAAAWVLLKEMAPTTFRATKELGDATGLPVMTALPDESWADAREMLADLKANPNSVYAERIRHLRTALTLRRPTVGRGHSVLVLGATQGDGKTTTALALTHMAALSGRTAIIVDCDLRKPKILKALGGRLNQTHDFSDYIEYRCDLPEAICRPSGCGFDVLAAKDAMRTGADALSVTWLGQVLRELERAYDFVIVDAPALLVVPDALIVAQEVETNLFVVACEETPRDLVMRSLSTLSELGIGVRGLVMNKVDPDRYTHPLEGGIGHEKWYARTWHALPSAIRRIGTSSGSAGGDHPLLARWNAWWRKGTGIAVQHVSSGRHFHPRLSARQGQRANPPAPRDHHIGR